MSGWDCPRAKILVKLRDNMNKNFENDTCVKFIEDKRINGLWNCLGIIENKEDFNLINVDKDGIINNLSFFSNGDVNATHNNGYSKSISYTYGFVKDFYIKGTMCAYEIQKVNEKDCLIIEWKSGDYVFDGFISCYYVFKKRKYIEIFIVVFTYETNNAKLKNNKNQHD